MRTVFVAAVVLHCFTPAHVSAQAADSVFAWFKNNGLSLRRTFDGSKNEGHPATLNLVSSKKPTEDSYYFADVALKVLEWEAFSNPRQSLLLYPVVEWHRSTQEEKAVDNISASLKSEFRPFPLRMQGAASGGGLTVAPTLMADFGRYWDEVADSSVTKLGLSIFPTSNIEGLPGSDIRGDSSAFRARYYPYLGLERWSSDGLWAGEDATFATLRLYVEWVPVGTLTREYIELISDFTRRWRTNNAQVVPAAMSMSTTSLTLYPNGTRQVGVGVDYAAGNDPSKAFVKVDRWTLGLKVKF